MSMDGYMYGLVLVAGHCHAQILQEGARGVTFSTSINARVVLPISYVYVYDTGTDIGTVRVVFAHHRLGHGRTRRHDIYTNSMCFVACETNPPTNKI